MKVILTKHTPGLGKKWDVKNVADGYARNYLFPKKLAEIATRQRLQLLEQEKERIALEAQKDLERFESLVSKLDGMEIVIRAKADENGRLFGSLGSAQISTALKEKGVNIPEEAIKMRAPLKEMGEHKVALEFDHGLEAEIKVLIENSTG